MTLGRAPGFPFNGGSAKRWIRLQSKPASSAPSIARSQHLSAAKKNVGSQILELICDLFGVYGDCTIVYAACHDRPRIAMGVKMLLPENNMTRSPVFSPAALRPAANLLAPFSVRQEREEMVFGRLGIHDGQFISCQGR